MKRVSKFVMVIFSSLYITAMSVYAGDYFNWEMQAKQEGLSTVSAFLPEGITVAEELDSVMRGRYIASSGLSISNEGYGVLGVYADTLAHVSVKKIKMTIYLDQWNDQDEDWEQIDSKELIYEDEAGDEDLHAVSESFLVENLETDKYYRLRGLHAVWSFDGYVESHATMTNGILLTDGPA